MENENLDKALEEVGKLIVSKLRINARKDGFKASGELDKSFEYRKEENDLKVFAEGYAGALSNNTKKLYKKEPNYKKLAEWAKIKGIRPLFRDKKGRFKKINKHSYNALGMALAKSIRENGIVKRFQGKPSKFIEITMTELKEDIGKKLSAAFAKDITVELKNIK